jgi:hypothetical protein
VTLTACLIVRNESRNLPRCLKSIRNGVDSIVVVDTGSSDDTVSIAKRFGAIVSEEPERTVDIGGGYMCLGDFAAARNRAFELAADTGASHYLVVDADHVYCPPTFLAIRKAKAMPDVHAAALRFHIASSPTARPADVVTGAKRIAQPFNSAALFRASLKPRYEGIIHETTTAWFRAQEANGTRQVVLADSRIADYGHNPTVRDQLGKNERNERMLRRAIQLDPTDPVPGTYLASDLVGQQRYDEAWSVLRPLLDRIGKDDRLLGSHLLRLCACWGILGFAASNPMMAWEAARTWERTDPRPHPDIDLIKGLACELWGKIPEARTFYRMATQRSAASVGSQHIISSTAADRLQALST